MKLSKRDDGWWIEDADPYYVDDAGPFTDYGPYGTKADATNDLRGLQAFEQLFQGECPQCRSVASLPPGKRDDVGECAAEKAGHRVNQALGQAATSASAV